MKQNDFNKIAPVYDLLARLIFGKSIINSQKHFLDRIPDCSTILILGGGTGEILLYIFNNKNKIRMCYIEASEKMISAAKQKLNSRDEIQFIHGIEDNIPNDTQFDVVVTNFYLDLFSEDSLRAVLLKVRKSTTQKAIWIVTDFVDDNFWQGLMLKMMYLFFKATCNIEAKKLPAWRNAMTEVGGKEIESNYFYARFIKSVIFQF